MEDVWRTREGGMKASSRLLQESLLFVLKDNVFVFGCPHTYQLLYDLGSGVLKVLENWVSMSAERRVPD